MPQLMPLKTSSLCGNITVFKVNVLGDLFGFTVVFQLIELIIAGAQCSEYEDGTSVFAPKYGGSL
jgi:hypothetical protein